jgi:hypothetical protein
MTTGVGMTLLLISRALASTTYDDMGFVLEAPDEGPFANGIGAPVVEWDGQAQQYVMFFESPLSTDELGPGCRWGWRIGRATSPDGLEWEIDEEPVIEPEPGTRWACSVSHPAVVRDNHEWTLLYAMEDDARNVGIGLATAWDGEDFAPDADPVIEGPQVGMPTVGLSDGLLYVTYVRVPNLAIATIDPDTHELVDGDTALTAASGPSWADNWLVTPALACVKHAGWSMVYAGFADAAAKVRSYAFASSPDGWTWTVGDAIPGSSSWAHADVTLADDQTLLWYSATADDGRKAIGLTWTGEPEHKPKPRECSVHPGRGR